MIAETIHKKTNENTAGNVCLYAADGTPITLVGDENAIAVVNKPYTTAIAEGAVPGHVPFFKLGYSPASSATETTLWNAATEYVFPVAPIQMEVVSTDNVNDKAGGTGALSMHIHYLDNLYNPQFELVVMNGTTAVPTVATNIFRINSFHVEGVGSTGKAAGTISIRSAVDHTTIYSQCAPGFTRSRNSVFTVPKGKTLYISDLSFSAGYKTSGKQVRVTLHASIDPMGTVSTSGVLFFPYREVILMDNNYATVAQMALPLPEKTDMKVSVIGETLALTSSYVSGWLE